MRHCHVRDKWETFMNLSAEQQILEQAFALLAKWLQPLKYCSYWYINRELDKLVRQVMNYLKTQHPQHSIFSMAAEHFNLLKGRNIKKHYWKEEETFQIVLALHKVMLHNLKFHDCENNLFQNTLKVFCLNQVNDYRL